MKIGILTFHNTTNYGAILQTYALQKYINSLGKDCEVIDYNNISIERQYNINPFKSKNIKEFIKLSLSYKSNCIKKAKFDKFLKKYVRLSKEKYSEENIKKADDIYDTFIAGSDQIWNLNLSFNDENYFLMFTEDRKKRNSYAASIGKSILDQETEKKLKKLIKEQNHISIREKSGKELLAHLTDNRVEYHIDPTFLISKEEWEKMIEKKSTNYKYIFVYEVSRTDNLRPYAKYLSEKTGYKIIFISGSQKTIKGAKKVADASPREFLNYIYNAEYVITSSFHGMALSIIFNKKFYYDTPRSKQSLGSRLENLAEIFHLQSRKIVANYDKCDNKKIDYERVNDLITKEKKAAIDYIEKIIS